MIIKWFQLFKRIGWLLLVMNLLPFPALFARRPDLHFQQITVEQGLAQNGVSCILQDRQGFMWFGTEQGLNRYDGYNFMVYKFQYDNPGGLNNSYITSIHQDSAGILWIGTKGGGLNRFHPEFQRFSHFFIDPERIDSPGNIINVIWEDPAGTLWVGTAGDGLKKFDPGTGTFTPIPLYAGETGCHVSITINALCKDSSGTLWIGTDAGLKQLDSEMHPLNPPGWEEANVLAIYRDKSRSRWVGTDNGFYRFDPGSREFIHHQIPVEAKHLASANTIRTIYEDRLGQFWLGTDYGLHRFHRRKNRFDSYFADGNDAHSLLGNEVRSIYEDRSGALWVGSASGGLNKLNRTGQAFNYYPSNPKKPESSIYPGVFAIYEDRENVLWIGTDGEGLNRFNRKSGDLVNYRCRDRDTTSLSDNRIWAICEDRRGKLWIGTAAGGLNRFSRQSGEFTRYSSQPQNSHSLASNTVSSILEDRDGVLWIGTNGGLNRYESEKDRFIRYQTSPDNPNTLTHNLIYVVYQDQEGLLWLGTEGGLCLFEPGKETFTSDPLDPRSSRQLIHHPIFSIAEDSEGVMWIGTTGGLNRIDRRKKISARYTEKDGLPNDVINGVLCDELGNIWLSTNKGLSKLDPRSGQFRNYSPEDGLQGSEFNGGAYYKSRSGEFFFGGQNGFNAFFPRFVKDNPYIPPVRLTDFKIFNQSIHIGEEFKGRVLLKKSITAVGEISLSYQDYIFSFEYAALNYVQGEKNQYAYMMQGLENSWNYVGQRRFVTYANLAPGEYVFRVKASNNHGVWNKQGASLKIHIPPPIWVTWWFKLLVFMLAVFLVLAFYKVKTRLILKRNRELAEMVANRTIDLRESGEKYRTVVERANSGIAIVKDEVIVFQNTQFARLLGYDEQDIINRPLLQLVPPGQQEQVRQLLAEAGAGKTSNGNFETALDHKNGEAIPVEIQYGIINYQKEPALLMFFLDIRMQKLLAEERMKTAKLESARILAGGIAHDFNNLLAIILGNIELALSDAPQANHLQKVLKEAEKSSLNAVELIRQFITLSKSDIVIKKKEFIPLMIREAVQAQLDSSPVSCRYHFPENLWPVECDTRQITQAFNNVVLNARQAMPEGGELEVEARNMVSAGQDLPGQMKVDYVCITFKDNGIGISKEDLPNIFDPYFSTRKEVTRKGLGLGLSVAHSIITMHKGTIDVASEAGAGTTVRICLPASIPKS